MPIPKTGQTNVPGPSLEKMVLAVKRQKPAAFLGSVLEKVSFLSVGRVGGAVRARHVERLDLKKQPLQYWQVTFGPDDIALEWTQPSAETVLQRRLFVAKNFLELLCLVEPVYFVSAARMRQLFLESLESAQGVFFKNAGALALDLDVLRRRVKELECQKSDFGSGLEKLNQQLSAALLENDQLRLKVASLGHVGDVSLKMRIVESVGRNPDFLPSRFAAGLDVPLSRVERALDELIAQGYLQPVG